MPTDEQQTGESIQAESSQKTVNLLKVRDDHQLVRFEVIEEGKFKPVKASRPSGSVLRSSVSRNYAVASNPG